MSWPFRRARQVKERCESSAGPTEVLGSKANVRRGEKKRGLKTKANLEV